MDRFERVWRVEDYCREAVAELALCRDDDEARAVRRKWVKRASLRGVRIVRLEGARKVDASVDEYLREAWDELRLLTGDC
jgi:hypothetical protein